MGATARTQQGLEVVRVDAERNLILVKGSVPGAKGTRVVIKPSVKGGNPIYGESVLALAAVRATVEEAVVEAVGVEAAPIEAAVAEEAPVEAAATEAKDADDKEGDK
jgi:hypothetical protein